MLVIRWCPARPGSPGPICSACSGAPWASAPDFDFSDALEELPARGDDTWTRATLDAFITAPEDFAPGTTMTFVGMPDPKERAAVIACLAQTGAGPGGE
ncbi:MAG: c-type cytochrome [Geminicoccaceae bacterium]